MKSNTDMYKKVMRLLEGSVGVDALQAAMREPIINLSDAIFRGGAEEIGRAAGDGATDLGGLHTVTYRASAAVRSTGAALVLLQLLPKLPLSIDYERCSSMPQLLPYFCQLMAHARSLWDNRCAYELLTCA